MWSVDKISCILVRHAILTTVVCDDAYLPEKGVHRVTIRNDSPGLVGRGGQIDGLNRRSNCLINNQIADKLSRPWSETWGLGGENCT